MAFMVNHLTGRACVSGTVEWKKKTPICTLFDAFSQELRKVFGVARGRPDASCPLMGMRQDNRSVADFAIDFRTRAHESTWNATSFCEDELVSYEFPSSLDNLIELATWTDLRIQSRRWEHGLQSSRWVLTDRNPCRWATPD